MLLFPEILIPTDENMKKVMKKLVSPKSKIYEAYPNIIDHMVLAMKCHPQKAMFVHKIKKYHEQEGQSQRDKLYFLLGDYTIG